MKKQGFIFCHGFGFNASFWAPLQPYFLEKKTHFLDLGYFGAPSVNVAPDDHIEWIGIGHSLGLMKLIAMNLPFRYLIGLNGFVNFLGEDTRINRHRTRELKYLTHQMERCPRAALTAFYQRAGVMFEGLENAAINSNQLLADLSELARPIPLWPAIPMLILGSTDDIIVPPELIKDNFSMHSNAEVALIHQAGHGLGARFPARVYQEIMRFISTHE
jgi:pimeloyl-[acyl-carrier protein] methyl ester esterase